MYVHTLQEHTRKVEDKSNTITVLKLPYTATHGLFLERIKETCYCWYNSNTNTFKHKFSSGYEMFKAKFTALFIKTLKICINKF